jgi:hypothetical protein
MRYLAKCARWQRWRDGIIGVGWMGNKRGEIRHTARRGAQVSQAGPRGTSALKAALQSRYARIQRGGHSALGFNFDGFNEAGMGECLGKTDPGLQVWVRGGRGSGGRGGRTLLTQGTSAAGAAGAGLAVASPPPRRRGPASRPAPPPTRRAAAWPPGPAGRAARRRRRGPGRRGRRPA